MHTGKNTLKFAALIYMCQHLVHDLIVWVNQGQMFVPEEPSA